MTDPAAADDADVAPHGSTPRVAADQEFDVFLSGTVFLDIIFTGLEQLPPPGAETWARGMGSSPGGIANLATAASRLGLSTSLAAAFGDDVYGEFCWRTLADQERIDLSRSRVFEHWHSPVTVSMSTLGDRTMVTHGHRAPVPSDELIGTPPRARAVLVDLDNEIATEALRDDRDGPGTSSEVRPSGWVEQAARSGSLVFADVGYDDTGTWSPAVLDRLEHCHAFVPNAGEAMAYTRTETPREALYALADRVPLAVVTNGMHGSMAIDSTTGEEAEVPAVRVAAIDPTGAGDVFATAIVLGTLSGWPLADRLAFGSVCSALAVQQFGGSLAAPGIGDVLDWWHHVRDHGAGGAVGAAPGAYTASLRRRYAFLDDLTPPAPGQRRHRAAATIARLSDLEA